MDEEKKEKENRPPLTKIRQKLNSRAYRSLNAILILWSSKKILGSIHFSFQPPLFKFLEVSRFFFSIHRFLFSTPALQIFGGLSIFFSIHRFHVSFPAFNLALPFFFSFIHFMFHFLLSNQSLSIPCHPL